MFCRGQRLAVAVSGGADSVCLLHVLVELAPQWDLSLAILHLDHRLRGEESRRDAEFVRDLAGAYGLPFHCAESDVTRLAQDSSDNLEQAARSARYGFFRGFLERGEADSVAVGHTRSDQAETVLFRLLRGAGTAGLAAIRPCTRDGFIRPLIEVDRLQVIQYLSERGIAWREDATNRSRDFARNRIRHELLPVLQREWNPAIISTLSHTADWALEEEHYWEQEIDRLAATHLTLAPPAVLLRADEATSLPVAAARRLIRRAVETAKGDLRAIDFQHIEGILNMCRAAEGHGRTQLPGLDVYRSFEWLRLAPPGLENLGNRNFRLVLPVPGQIALSSQRFIRTEIDYNRHVGSLDWDRVSGQLEVRNWRPGDQYHPIGHSDVARIKLLFQQARVPLWERRSWPVVTCGDAIIWTRQFGPAKAYAATPETRRVLRIWETAE